MLVTEAVEASTQSVAAMQIATVDDDARWCCSSNQIPPYSSVSRLSDPVLTSEKPDDKLTMWHTLLHTAQGSNSRYYSVSRMNPFVPDQCRRYLAIQRARRLETTSSTIQTHGGTSSLGRRQWVKGRRGARGADKMVRWGIVVSEPVKRRYASSLCGRGQLESAASVSFRQLNPVQINHV